ncbi:tetratricopeptide repeat protein [Nevskia soli]|uniref:tetratricopeptide repeat protein n=1 Tax=Nevskia soli TaxID=418856 RepID=UPI0004A730C4|nr:tetratricopeptide repeat protein [Nevskia soli]
MSARPSFFSELKRRNVYKVGAMYAVAGWLLVQIVTQVFPIFHVSELVQRILVLAVVAGFPVALVLSWIYELTPQGIVRTDEVAPDASVTRATGQKLNRAIIGILSLAVLMLAARLLWPHVDIAPSPQTAAVDGDKSIAVLPFENLSDDKANAYFASGIQDEILTKLAKIGALKVISRTSTAHYASSPDNLPQIARALGVANILEGSVQKVGDAVHVNVQLIRAATDDHLWAETYDRKLDDIFGVEGEVAGAIAAQLKARLSGAEQQALDLKLTDNPQAYDLYLRGRAAFADDQSVPGYKRLAAAMAEAVRIDPQFAQAWAEQSIAAGYLYFNGIEQQTYTPELVRTTAETAIHLQPDLPLARQAQGAYLYRVKHDFPAAQSSLEAALALAPNDVGILSMLGWDERRQGHFEQALAHLEKAAELDPHNAQLFSSIGGETLLGMWRWDEAQMWLDRALALTPNDPLARTYKILGRQREGRIEDAAKLLGEKPEAGEDPLLSFIRIEQRLLEHRYDQAIAESAPVLARPQDELEGFGPFLRRDLGIAQLRAGRGADAHATFAQLIHDVGPDGADRVDDSLRPMLLAVGYAGTGDMRKAVEQARHATELYRDDHIWLARVVESQAQVQAWAGDRDGAMATLQALQGTYGASPPSQMKLDPMWDPLRDDPRFQKLLAGSHA